MGSGFWFCWVLSHWPRDFLGSAWPLHLAFSLIPLVYRLNSDLGFLTMLSFIRAHKTQTGNPGVLRSHVSLPRTVGWLGLVFKLVCLWGLQPLISPCSDKEAFVFPPRECGPNPGALLRTGPRTTAPLSAPTTTTLLKALGTGTQPAHQSDHCLGPEVQPVSTSHPGHGQCQSPGHRQPQSPAYTHLDRWGFWPRLLCTPGGCSNTHPGGKKL